MDDLHQALHKVDKAKFEMMRVDKGTTFFTALLAGVKYIYNDEVPYAATDGINMWLNPDFINQLSTEEIVGLLMHETGHIIYEHPIICAEGKLDKETHNIAGDHYINLWLLSKGFTLPHFPPAYADKKYIGWSTMQIYKDLLKNKKPPPKQYMFDVKVAPKGMSSQEHKLKITNIIMKAVLQAEIAKDYGSIPGEVAQLIEKIRSPELPWTVILANYMEEYARDDYSWSRPNKRFLPDFYLPTMRSIHMGQLTVGMDVSGSTTGRVLALQFAEVKYLFETLQPKQMHLMTFDTKVHLNEFYAPGDDLDEVKIKGGGGTNVNPLLQSIIKEQPVLALIFTDGYFSMPDMKDIVTDIIWIVTGNAEFKPPKGIVIHFNDPGETEDV
jgi:predicted metal-dependent peptidase